MYWIAELSNIRYCKKVTKISHRLWLSAGLLLTPSCSPICVWIWTQNTTMSSRNLKPQWCETSLAVTQHYIMQVHPNIWVQQPCTDLNMHSWKVPGSHKQFYCTTTLFSKKEIKPLHRSHGLQKKWEDVCAFGMVGRRERKTVREREKERTRREKSVIVR